MTKLWILVRVPCDSAEFCLENCCERYDVLDSVLVRAKDEDEARRLAASASKCEGPNVWIHESACGAHATCNEVPVDGDSNHGALRLSPHGGLP